MHNCFKKNSPISNPQNSSTYNIPCNSKTCNAIDDSSTCDPHTNFCQYAYQYGDISFTTGDLAVDSFTFISTSHHPILIPKIVFGCGHNNVGRYNESTSGIIGLVGGHSFKSKARVGESAKERKVEGNIVIDLGTTLTFIPNEMYSHLEAKVKECVNVDLQQEVMFLEVEKGLVCLMIVPSDNFAIVEKLSQMNLLFRYDLVKKKRTYCTKH
ncbi:hypothetical protein LguiB_019236 [Lonicera macranthoides]